MDRMSNKLNVLSGEEDEECSKLEFPELFL